MRSSEELLKDYRSVAGISKDEAYRCVMLEALLGIRDVLVSLKEEQECDKVIK